MQASNLDDHNFTVYNKPNINLIIASQIREVSELVLSRVKDVISLILIGGYARGEGSVIVTSKGLIPLGDYDFLMVTKYPHLSLNFPELELLRRKFRVQYHIEVGNTWKLRLPFVDKQIYWYEVKFGSKLVYGNPSVLSAIPIGSSLDINLKEGFRLMFNRLMGMLRVFDPSFVEHDPTEEQKEHLIFQSVKGILACGESLLLLNGVYHYSYRKRLKKLSECFEECCSEFACIDFSFKEDFEKASRFKLSPSYDMYNDPVKLWFSARRHLLQTLVFFLAKTGQVKNINVLKKHPFEQFPTYFLSCSKPRLLDYLMFNRTAVTAFKSFKGVLNVSYAFSDIVRLAIYYLALSISGDRCVDSYLLQKSLKTLESIYPVHVKTDGSNLKRSWKDAENAIFSAWQCSRQ
jgi:hypothetical protein